MATFKPEIQNKRADGTYNVRIRVTHNRQIKRISTSIYATPADLTKSLSIKNVRIQNLCDDIIIKCRDFCSGLGFAINTMSIDELIDKLKNHLQGGDKFELDFINYANQKIEEMSEGTAVNYRVMVNALRRFIMRDDLDISEISASFLRSFERFIESEPSQRGSNRKTKQKETETKGGRAVSLYLSCIRAIHNKAKTEYNDEDRGLIRIPYSPFKNFKIKPQPKTKKRALPVETIQAIIDVPYEPEKVGGKWSRFNLAKDCFIMSFVLVGMNSVDMYHAGALTKESVLGYNRRKTESRRDDSAEIRVRVEGAIAAIMERYQDDKQLFNFYRHYVDHEGFNKAINKGLKQVGQAVGVEGLNFYAARHSWATIARSAAVGVDKATVHEALNHADKDMKVTDIYIERDWSVIWGANEKVLALFDWSAVGYDLL